MGRHFWRIENSDGQGALEKCLSWVLQNKAWKFLERYNELIKSDSEMACPCTGWQAIFDWGRFRWNWWNSWPEFCFESRSFRSFKINTTSGPLDFQLRQKCCYSTDWQDWGSLKRGPPDGGRVDVTFRYDSNNSFYTDEQAYKSCCVDSLNCRLFYDLRPSDSCSNYVPRPRREFYLVFMFDSVMVVTLYGVESFRGIFNVTTVMSICTHSLSLVIHFIY